MSQSQANEWVHRLSGLLKQALGYEMQLPERRAANLEAVLSACPSLGFIIDGTERPINRPKDKEKQKGYYSGKKKGHTVKNDLITTRGGNVRYLSRICEGKLLRATARQGLSRLRADWGNGCYPTEEKAARWRANARREAAQSGNIKFESGSRTSDGRG